MYATPVASRSARDGREVRDALLAERLADLRRLVEGCADRLGLCEVVVEDAQRARRDLGPRIGVEPVLVLREPRAQRLEVGGAAVRQPIELSSRW